MERTGGLDAQAVLAQRARMSPAALARADRAELRMAARSIAKVWLLRHEIEGVPLPEGFLDRHPEARATPDTATARATGSRAKTAADYPRRFQILDGDRTASQSRTYWCGPTSMQMIAWGWQKRAKSQAHWARRLNTTTSGTSIWDMVRVVNQATGYDQEKYAGPYIVLDIGRYSYDKWMLLMMRHIHDYRAPVVLHPILLKRFYPYLDDDASGHFQVGRGFAKRGKKPDLLGYFEPWNQQRFDPSEPYIKRVQWRNAYRSFRANKAHFAAQRGGLNEVPVRRHRGGTRAGPDRVQRRGARGVTRPQRAPSSPSDSPSAEPTPSQSSPTALGRALPRGDEALDWQPVRGSVDDAVTRNARLDPDRASATARAGRWTGPQESSGSGSSGWRVSDALLDEDWAVVVLQDPTESRPSRAEVTDLATGDTFTVDGALRRTHHQRRHLGAGRRTPSSTRPSAPAAPTASPTVDLASRESQLSWCAPKRHGFNGGQIAPGGDLGAQLRRRPPVLPHADGPRRHRRDPVRGRRGVLRLGRPAPRRRPVWSDDPQREADRAGRVPRGLRRRGGRPRPGRRGQPALVRRRRLVHPRSGARRRAGRADALVPRRTG